MLSWLTLSAPDSVSSRIRSKSEDFGLDQIPVCQLRHSLQHAGSVPFHWQPETRLYQSQAPGSHPTDPHAEAKTSEGLMFKA